MSDQLTVYSSIADTMPGDVMEQFANAGKSGTCTARTDENDGQWYDLVWPNLRVSIRHFECDESDFAEHIRGFLGYVLHMAEGHMDPRLWEIYYLVSKTRQGFGLTIEPEWDDEIAPALVAAIAETACGFVFIGDQLTDPWGGVLLAPGNQRGAGVLHSFESAKERRERSSGRLAMLGLATPDSLPMTVADEEGYLRPPQEVAQRAVALMAVAMRAEGVAQPRVVKFLQQRGATKAVSPEEKSFLQAVTPDNALMQKLTWRYEALWTLLWALGHVDSLGPADKQCDAKAAVKIINEMPVDRFVGQAKFRQELGILDELDFYYRAHWHVVAARQAQRPVPEGLDEDIIYERHYALNWLTHYLYQEWDDVTTDT